MADVFVSYSRVDKERVAPLVAAIEAKGWSVWWDSHMAPGQEFDRVISAELAAAKAVVVVWTPSSVESRYVRGEAREAADRNVLVPVRFERARLPIDARAIHTIDLDDWGNNPLHSTVGQLMAALEAVISRRADSKLSSPVTVSARPQTSTASLCVLSFVNMSDDPQQEYFSEGITEDIVTDLNKVSALAVIPRKTKVADIAGIAKQLGVSHVLAGSVRKSGERLRITAQLTDGVTGQQVWAERFDRNLDDIFALQDEISGAIVKALKIRLLPEERDAIARRGTANAEAYNLYLMARQRYVSGDQGDPNWAEGIIRLARRATEIEPNYALAWAFLGLGQAALRWTHGHSGDGGSAAADRAIALDPALADAHVIKGRIFQDDGLREDAFRELRIAYDLDAKSWFVNYTAGLNYYYAGHFDEAAKHFERAIALDETDVNAPAFLIGCCERMRDQTGAARAAELALSHAENVLEHDRENLQAMATRCRALAALGETERARALMDRVLLLNPDHMVVRYNVAYVAMRYFNDADAAMDLLEPALVKMTRGWVDLVKPGFSELRDHPRFKAMIAAAEARLASEKADGAQGVSA